MNATFDSDQRKCFCSTCAADSAMSAAVIKPLSLAEDAEHKLPQACFSKTP